MTNKYIQVVTATDSEESAEQIAAAALAARLAACIQIDECRSWFHWQGKVEQAREFRCTLKSRKDLYPALAEIIRRHHPYQVPEILATEIWSVSDAYLAWMDKELKGSEGERG